MLACIEQFVGDGRLVGQLRQFVQLTVQAIHFRDVQHVARMVQPDLNALDTRQLFSKIFRLLLIALQLQSSSFFAEQTRQPAVQLRVTLTITASIAVGGPGAGQQPA